MGKPERIRVDSDLDWGQPFEQLAARLRDARRAAGVRRALTFPSRFPMLRIDHIFTSPSVEVGDLHAPDGALAKVASDHLPLVADLTLSAAPTPAP